MKLLSVFALIAGTMVVTTEAIKLRALEGEGTAPAPAPNTDDGAAADDTADNAPDNNGDDTGDNGADEPTEPTVEEFVDSIFEMCDLDKNGNV